MSALLGMGVLSAAMLLLQVALTRVFSIAQFYHFAFLVISLALLGFGASGSLLAVWPRLRSRTLGGWYAFGFALSTVIAYLFVNTFPFDSYSIAWDEAQLLLLVGNLLALAVPFVFAGALIAALLSEGAAEAGRIYSANLFGSAAGAVLAPLVIGWLGSERAVLLCAAGGMGAALVLADARLLRTLAVLGLAGSMLLAAVFPALFEVQPSPYKRLSHFRLNPDAAITTTRQNAYARLDVIESSTIHSAQGLSLTYFGALPPQIGLLVDGDGLLPVSEAAQSPAALAGALPSVVAYALRPAGRVLLLGSGGSMEAWAALTNGAAQVTVVEPNALVAEVLSGGLRAWAGLDDPRLSLLHDEIRAYTQHSPAGPAFDVVQLTLADNYRPVNAGAFTLTENYTLTVEAVRAYLAQAAPDGVLLLTRWLQDPPSESLRTLALLVEALDVTDPAQHIVAFRSFQTMTFVVKPIPFTAGETDTLLEAIGRLRYDLVLAPEIPPDMVNRYARLERDVYHDLFLGLVNAPDRAAFYDAYDFDITPPTDDHPFFFHFFRWQQTPDILQNLGQRWQPFGGSGFFVLVALLGFAVAAAAVLILLPVRLRARFRAALRGAGQGRAGRALGYFAAIGLAYLLVEVSLIQRFMLVLGQPTLAVAAVIGALLLWSGLGSALSARWGGRRALVGLAAGLAVYPVLAGWLTPPLLALPLAGRVLAVGVFLAPPGVLMGMPFARGIAALADAPDLVPWAWAVNGSASVVSSVLAVLLALWLGFTPVLWVGGALYLLAAWLRN